MDWFKSFPADYRDDTWHLTLAEHGAYKLLIDHYMHHEKPLPDNDNALASIVGVDPQTWALVSVNVREFFTPKKGKLVHKRCETELNQSFEKRKDGKKRASKYRNSLNTVTRDERVSNAPRGEERRGEESRVKEDTKVSPKKTELLLFDEFWNLFPRQRRGGKTQAESAYRKALSENKATEQELLEGVTNYAGSREVADGYGKGAAAWINDDRWTSDYSAKSNDQFNGSNGGTSITAARNTIVAEIEEEQRLRSGGGGNQSGFDLNG